MRKVLSLPAPTPRTAEKPEEAEPEQPARPPKFYRQENPPPDDAPMEDLLLYWRGWASQNLKPHLSDAVKQRLLEACIDEIGILPSIVQVFPSEESTAKKIKELFDKAVNDQLLDDSSREKVQKWLLYNSKYYVSDLFALASKVKDNQNGGYVHNEDALTGLARVDWQTAESLVNALAAGNQPRSSAVALTLLYKHAISEKDSDAEEKYRNRLKTIATDRNAPAHARDTSIEALSFTEWSGRDEWYLSLLADESLRESHDGSYGFLSLQMLFNRDPEKWIPIMAKLVESKDRVVQQAAASCLVVYATDYPRKDAILPVLRWLSDPDWLRVNSSQRAWFIQTMDDLELPESVPGLIWIVENETSQRQWAARTLATYKDPRAIPALKKALAKSSESERQLILEGLFGSGGVSDSEAIAALEAYAAKQMTAEDREEVENSIPVSIGEYLARLRSVPDSLIRSVLARAENLNKTNPAMAQALLEIANRWHNRQIDLDIIQRIANRTADANTIATAMERRTKLRENLGPELQAMLMHSGEPLGFGSILLNDAHLAQSILTSDDQPAQIALLAGARLTQTPLPVELVGALLPSKNALLALAAERYLLVEDSKDAQKLLWRHHPNQAFVTGWRESIPLIGVGSFGQLEKAEEKLRAELFKADGPVEIFALLSNYGYYDRVLRIYADRAICTFDEDPARYVERVVSKAELTAFKEFVTTEGLKDLGPQFSECHHDCSASQFLALRKDEGRRVFSHQGFGGSMRVVADNFDRLIRGEGAKTHYRFESEIKGLEVVYAAKDLAVKDVWQRGDEIRIFVEREQTEEEFNRRYGSNSSEEEDEAARIEQRRQELADREARFSWRKLTGDKAGAVVAQPDSYSTFNESNYPKDDANSEGFSDEQVQIVSAGTILIARNFEGLWKQTAGTNAVRISEGTYAYPIVTPDGKWVVVARAAADWSRSSYVVRFNLQTGQEFRVNLAPAHSLLPVVFLPLHNKILVRRAKNDFPASYVKSIGPDRPEYYLLDAATGDTQLVSGELEPLRQRGKRFLQPAAKPDEFWAALPDGRKNQTQVGRYNLKNFSFKPVLVVPQISFDSMSMWVDESRDKIYVVYKDQLLRLPLKSTVGSN
ncbi:MAG TPA: HEAT repeat domain-containing protein [Pyrinomonadaceae bacterium]